MEVTYDTDIEEAQAIVGELLERKSIPEVLQILNLAKDVAFAFWVTRIKESMGEVHVGEKNERK